MSNRHFPSVVLLFLSQSHSFGQGAPPEASGLKMSFVEERAVRLQFQGDATQTWWVEASKDLANWQQLPLPANLAGGTTFEIFDPTGIAGGRKFYRVPAPVAAMTPVPEPLFQRLGNLGEAPAAGGTSFTTSYPESVLVPLNDPAFGQGYAPGDRAGAAELAPIRAQGLQSWRRFGAHGSCASCHGPDGFDLAVIGYSNDDIRRRALDHVSPTDADRIVQLIKATRHLYGIERPLHPLNFRPLQPGHEVLPGDTAEQRDLEFGNFLRDAGIIWARERIESRAQALAAQAQFRALDLRKLRIGIPFDRWSEDAHRGAAHLNISEWIPNMAMHPKPERAAEWHALQDAYLADPTDANFWRWYDRIDDYLIPVEPPGYELGQRWSLLKYKSVQVAQHMLRHQSLSYPDALNGRTNGVVANRSAILARNPIFRTGDHVRRFPLQYDAANASTLFPPHLANTLPADQTALRDQNQNFFRVWFWMGWVYDPALLLSDSIFQTVEGDYLYSSLLAHYKLHHAFVMAMTSVAKANATAWFNADGPGLRGHGKWAAFNPFMVLHHVERDRNEPPPGDPRIPMHDLMFSNTARLWIYLVHNDLERTASVYDRYLVRGCISFCRTWLEETEPGVDHTALDAVIADIESRLASAQELRTDFSGDDLPGALPFLPRPPQ